MDIPQETRKCIRLDLSSDGGKNDPNNEDEERPWQ